MIIIDIIEYVTSPIVKRFKAPKGLMYEVNFISIEVMTVGAGKYIYIFNDAKIQDDFVINDDAIERCLGVCRCDSSPVQYQWIFKEPHITKYLTIISSDGFNNKAFVLINCTLKKASLSDLVWEFVKKAQSR